MENSALHYSERGFDVTKESDRYYFVYGRRFEKDRKYTYEDYKQLPETMRVDLIDGVFYEKYPIDPEISLAAPSRAHQTLVLELGRAIGNYIAEKNGSCKVYVAPFSVRLTEDDKNAVEPDVSVICDPSKLTEEGCNGAPDWIIEVLSPTTASNDYVRKLNKYMDAGVREYWIVDPEGKRVSVYEFGQGNTVQKQYSFEDNIKAGIYEDLFIDLSTISI